VTMTYPKENRARLLLVEDDEHLAELIILYLWSDDSDVRIEHATRVSDAKKAMANKKFDLLISDYDLPDGNGLDVVKAFYTFHKGAQAIMMSARNDPSFRSEVTQAGVIKLFEKPLPLSELQASVRSLTRT